MAAKTASVSSGGLEQATKIVLGSIFEFSMDSSKQRSNMRVQETGHGFAAHVFVDSCFPSHFRLSAVPWWIAKVMLFHQSNSETTNRQVSCATCRQTKTSRE